MEDSLCAGPLSSFAFVFDAVSSMAFKEPLHAVKGCIVGVNCIFDPEMQIPGPENVRKCWVGDGRLDLLREADLRHRFMDVHFTISISPQDSNVSVSIVQKIVGALIRVGSTRVALEDLVGRGRLEPKVFQHCGILLFGGNVLKDGARLEIPRPNRRRRGRRRAGNG